MFHWPTKQTLRMSMNQVVRNLCSRKCCINDSSENFTEQSSAYQAKVKIYSNDKNKIVQDFPLAPSPFFFFNCTYVFFLSIDMQVTHIQVIFKLFLLLVHLAVILELKGESQCWSINRTKPLPSGLSNTIKVKAGGRTITPATLAMAGVKISILGRG